MNCEKLDIFNYWRLCDKLSFFQTILLILGLAPRTDDAWEIENRIPEYEAIKTALHEGAR